MTVTVTAVRTSCVNQRHAEKQLNKEDVYEVVDADAVSDDEGETPSEPRI